MKYSLVSRDWIADCIEITHAGYTGVRYEVSFKGDFPKFLNNCVVSHEDEFLIPRVIECLSLETSISTVETSVSSLETSVSSLETSVSFLETSVSSLETSVSSLEHL